MHEKVDSVEVFSVQLISTSAYYETLSQVIDLWVPHLASKGNSNSNRGSLIDLLCNFSELIFTKYLDLSLFHSK